VNRTGLLVLAGGYTISAWAVITNRYFSSYVRIQKTRQHQVVDQGPYRIVRHPGYAGNLLAYLGVPFLLNSWWTFAAVALAFVVFVLRTAKEDRYLQENLPGYTAFSQRTRYRLLPGVW
jgi:protein-S-isoprenylcysteine O-methyltransferase Ste14